MGASSTSLSIVFKRTHNHGYDTESTKRPRRKPKRAESCAITTSRSRPTLSTLINTCTSPSLPSPSNLASFTHIPRMAYIEENLKIRSRPQEGEEVEVEKPYDAQDEVFKAASEKWKAGLLGSTSNDGKKRVEEGSVTSSMGMLTAIPEVDLGME